MDSKPYQTILENLKTQGEAEIDRLISLGEQESFYMDYKEVSTTFPATRLSDDDRKNYAKAISGFSNTSGGILIWGVAESGGAFVKKETDSPDKLVRLLNDEVRTLTLPSRADVNSFAITLSNGKGYVVTEIPKYFFSPVQVVLKSIRDIAFKYFIRAGSSFEPANHDLISGLYNRQRASRLICFWATSGEGDFEETAEHLIYRIKIFLQNKGPGVLRDVWVNLSSGGLELELEKTSQTDPIFQGWNVWDQAINLISKDGYKCGPQHIISPFIIHLKIKKIPVHDESYLYISFGADEASPNELDIKLEKPKIEAFVAQPNKSCKDFLKHFCFAKEE